MIIESQSEAKYIIRATSKFCDFCSFNVCDIKDRCKECMMEILRRNASTYLTRIQQEQK